MSRLRRAMAASGVLSALLAGCSGDYVLTVPDTVAPAGDEVPVVLRLERMEIPLVLRPVHDAAMRIRLDDGPMRGALTDRLGYAGTLVPPPTDEGRHELTVAHLDRWGNEVESAGRAFLWDANAPVLAVDADAIPLLGPGASQAGEALTRLAQGARIAYFTQLAPSLHDDLRRRLDRQGCPEGPVLLWRSENWHVVSTPLRLPRLVVEQRLVSQLSILRELFPNLRRGVTADGGACRAFLDAGLEPVVVGPAGRIGLTQAQLRRSIVRESWQQLAERGI